MITTIEFKRIALFQYDRFRVASKATLQNGQGFRVEEGLIATLKPDTNAFIITQQALAYRDTWCCDYVAFCDFENLVLLRLTRAIILLI